MKGQSKIDNPQKLATQVTQDEKNKNKKQKTNKPTTQYVLNTTISKQTQIT